MLRRNKPAPITSRPKVWARSWLAVAVALASLDWPGRPCSCSGRFRWGNARPLPAQIQPTTQAVSSEATPFELQLAIKNAPVTLYTSPSCKEGCAAARDSLNKRGVPFAEAEYAHAQIPNSELVKLDGEDHLMVIAKHKQLNDAIVAFIKAHP